MLNLVIVASAIALFAIGILSNNDSVLLASIAAWLGAIYWALHDRP